MNWNNRVTPNEIIDKVVAVEGLYHKVFGDLLYDLVQDRGIARAVHIMKTLYGMKNAGEVFLVPLDRGEFTDLTKILFKHQEYQRPYFVGNQ